MYIIASWDIQGRPTNVEILTDTRAAMHKFYQRTEKKEFDTQDSTVMYKLKMFEIVEAERYEWEK